MSKKIGPGYSSVIWPPPEFIGPGRTNNAHLIFPSCVWTWFKFYQRYDMLIHFHNNHTKLYLPRMSALVHLLVWLLISCLTRSPFIRHICLWKSHLQICMCIILHKKIKSTVQKGNPGVKWFLICIITSVCLYCCFCRCVLRILAINELKKTIDVD